MKAFFKRLQEQPITRGVEDVMTWQVSKGGIFTVKSYYLSLAICKLKVPLVGIVWNPWVSNTVNCSTWVALWGIIITLDELKRRG